MVIKNNAGRNRIVAILILLLPASLLVFLSTRGCSHKFKELPDYGFDMSDIQGQEQVKRALEIAAAGSHNIFMRNMFTKYIMKNLTHIIIFESNIFFC